MIYGCRRMIYLLRKHDIISVPSYAAGIYHPPQVDIISKIYHPFRQELADYPEVDRSGLSAEIGKLRQEGLLDSHRREFILHEYS